MVTLRTPPQRAHTPPGASTQAIEEVGSESDVFKPRKPIPRTPPGGFGDVPVPVQVAREEEEDVEMEIDPPEERVQETAAQGKVTETTPKTPARGRTPSADTTSTTPLVPPSVPSTTPQNHAPVTAPMMADTTPDEIVSPPTQSTSPPPQASTAQSPPPPISTADMTPEILNQTYGTRYKNLTQALESALKASTSKWTYVSSCLISSHLYIP
jgi:hypothetical protein